MNELYEYKDRTEIEENGTKLGDIRHRPLNSLIIMVIVGLLLCIVPSTGVRILGAVIIIGALILFFITKNRVDMEVYSDALILYSAVDPSKAVRIPVDDIAEWQIDAQSTFQITLKLSNGNHISASCFQAGKADKLLRKIMADKQTWTVQRNEAERLRKQYPGPLKQWWQRHFNKNH